MIASSSNLPTLLSSGGDGGWGGGGMAAILVVVVLVAVLGGGGLGGRGCNDAADNAEINGRFNSIENQIDNLGNREDLARNLMAVCETQRDVLESKFELSQEINQNRFDTAIGFKDVELQIANCCCTTNSNIEALRGEIKEQNLQNRIYALESKLNEVQAKPAYITYAPGTAYYPPTNAVGFNGYGLGYGACAGF